MSITFTANVADASHHFVEEPCLCAQMSERFSAAFDGDLSEPVRRSLRDNAWKDCPHCAGTGVEHVLASDRPELNLCNDNARRLLAALGLEPDGEVPIPDARRTVLRARNVSLAPYARQGEVVHGRPRTRADGAVELRPVRYQVPALTENDLHSRVESFAALVEAAAERGATTISWE